MNTREYLKRLNERNVANLSTLKRRESISQIPTDDGTSNNAPFNNKVVLSDFENAIKVVDKQQTETDEKTEFINLLLPYIKDFKITESIVDEIPIPTIKVLLYDFNNVADKLNNLQGKKITKQSLIDLIKMAGDELLTKTGKNNINENQLALYNNIDANSIANFKTTLKALNKDEPKDIKPEKKDIKTDKEDELMTLEETKTHLETENDQISSFMTGNGNNEAKNMPILQIKILIIKYVKRFSIYSLTDWIIHLTKINDDLSKNNKKTTEEIINNLKTLYNLNPKKKINSDQVKNLILDKYKARQPLQKILNVIITKLNSIVENNNIKIKKIDLELNNTNKQINEGKQDEELGQDEGNQDEELGQETAGGGVSLKSIFEEHIDPKKKYFINKKKLKDNILDIRYSKNRHLIPIKTQYISGNVKHFIETLLSKGKLDKGLYHKLSNVEKNLVRSVQPYFGSDTDFEDGDAFNTRFDVIRGELLAGNNSNALKQEARQYLLHALNTSRISRHFYINCLQELGL